MGVSQKYRYNEFGGGEERKIINPSGAFHCPLRRQRGLFCVCTFRIYSRILFFFFSGALFLGRIVLCPFPAAFASCSSSFIPINTHNLRLRVANLRQPMVNGDVVAGQKS